MIQVAIIVGSTRPGRKAEIVARWVHGIARRRGDAQFEVGKPKRCATMIEIGRAHV